MEEFDKAMAKDVLGDMRYEDMERAQKALFNIGRVIGACIGIAVKSFVFWYVGKLVLGL